MRIGLVLSGGGARGYAQLGALKVLKDNNIQFTAISGCSIGALIGACYAFDQDIDRISQLLISLKSKKDVYDFSFSTKGLIKGIKLEEYISGYFNDKNIRFEDLKIPLTVNATDIANGQEVIFNSGLLMPSIMASLSYPGFFTMRKVSERHCIDGGVVNPVPADLLNDIDYAIIIDVSSETKDINDNSNIKDIILQSTWIMQKVIVEKSLVLFKKPYALIRPDVSKVGVMSFKDAEKLIKTGELEALKHISKIIADIR